MAYRGLKTVLASVLAGAVAMVSPGVVRAASITEFASGVTSPGAMAAGSDGNVWFINGDGIARIDASGDVTTFSSGLDAGATPYDLTPGPNGDLWFTDNGTKAVGYVTPSGAIHEFSAPAGEVPLQIVAGSDGNLWFYSAGAAPAIVKMTPAGTFTAYPMPTLGEIADNMVVGPDGAIWFSDMGTTSIGTITPSGNITEYPLTTGAIPTNITVGSDGNLWFSDNSGAIGRITTSGSVQEFKTGLQTGADPDAITPGPDGNVWFTDQYGNQRAIGRITPLGKITEFTAGLNDDLPLDITTGADGNLWVPQASMDPMTPSAVAEITTSGEITEITAGVDPAGLQDGDAILAGPNGALWFTDSNPAKTAIGRIVIAPVSTTGAATAVSSATATISGSVTPLADTTAVSIQYGTTPSLGSSIATGSLAPSMTKRSVTGALAALPSNTTIYYRLVATNSAGESDGTIESFETLPAASPPARTQTTIRTIGNQRITLTTPTGSICRASNSKLPVRLDSSAIKNSKQPKLKFLNARFYIDKGVKHRITKTVRKHGKHVKITLTTYRANATVTKLPASPGLKLSGLPSGRHSLTVAVAYIEAVSKHAPKTQGNRPQKVDHDVQRLLRIRGRLGRRA